MAGYVERVENGTDAENRVEFTVLGSTGIAVGTRCLPVKARRQRVVLVMLLLHAGEYVGIDSLVDAVWDDSPPRTARTQVQICVSALRRMISDLGVAAEIITTWPSAYRLSLDGCRFDLREFEELCATAHAFAKAGRLEDAVSVSREALRLFKGKPLAGVPGAAVESAAVRIEKNRLAILENLTEWELELGKAEELLDELARRVDEYPLRERSRAQLMLALHRAGRRAEALEAYRVGRRELVEQLGIEPARHLRDLVTKIHANDEALSVGGMGYSRRG